MKSDSLYKSSSLDPPKLGLAKSGLMVSNRNMNVNL